VTVLGRVRHAAAIATKLPAYSSLSEPLGHSSRTSLRSSGFRSSMASALIAPLATSCRSRS
jgi:hypothetical protein